MSYLTEKSITNVCILAFVINITFALLYFGILSILNTFSQDNLEIRVSTFDRSVLSTDTIIISYVIIGPLIETLISQSIPLALSDRYFSLDTTLTVLFSAIVFGLLHYQSPLYMFYTFFHGIVYAIVYVTVQKKMGNPYICVFVIHAVFNLLVASQDFIKNFICKVN